MAGITVFLRMQMKVARLCVFLSTFAFAAVCQINDATHMGQPVPINNWKVQSGDDARWASPDFNDSAWKVIPADKPWEGLGIGNLRGYIWLRARVLIPEEAGQLGVQMVLIGPHQVFADGKLVGTAGQFPPHGLVFSEVPLMYPFRSAAGQNTTEIAIRFWLWPALNRIGRAPGLVRIGRVEAMRAVQELELRRILDNSAGSVFLMILYVMLAVSLSILFYRQRKQTEYLWLALAIVGAVVSGVINLYADLVSVDNPWTAGPNSFLSAFSAICVLEFTFRFLREKTPGWVRAYQFILVLNLLRMAAVFNGWLPLADSNLWGLLLFTPYWFATPVIVLWRYLRGNKEAGLLAVPLFLMFGVEMSNALHWSLWRLRLRDTLTPFIPDVQLPLLSIAPETISHFLFLLSIGALILYRFQKVQGEQTRAQSELEAARKMQEIMVPPAIEVEGFRIDCAYIPAQEVGGDFYQIFPGQDGSLLIVIGDVSGKGLNAAMLVSLIIGALRQAVQGTREPARLLNEVNEVLSGHTDGRFATCCCASIRRDGEVTFANAGHLPPYCDGVEIETPGGVPLGVVSGTDYEQMTYHVRPGQRLLFLSDGVAEARNAAGELYGFERTRLISIEPVKQIADTAKSFGQEDDITVLAVAMQPTLVTIG